MNTVDRVYKVLSRFNYFSIVIQPESRLIEDLGLDSLTMYEFLVELEREFCIQIDDEDVTKENFKTVRTVSLFLESRI